MISERVKSNIYTVHPARSNHSLLLAFAVLLLIIFVLGLVLKYQLPFLPQINRLAGIAIMALYGLIFLHYRLRIPKEILLYGGFILWGVISGAIVAADRDLFLKSVRTLVQLWGLVWAVSGFTFFQKDAKLAFIPLIVGGVAIVGYSLISGEYRAAVDPLTGERIASILTNPNDLGFYAFLSIVGILYFWRRTEKMIIRICLLSLVGVLALGIVYSGSRKAFLGLMAFGLLWLWFCYRMEIFSSWRNMLLILVVITGGYLLVNYAIEATVMGSRLQLSIESGGLGATRSGLYREGWDFFLQNPIAGLGFGNFVAYSFYEQYSHSDYMEALATTGILGFLIYFSIYPVLWKKIAQVARTHETTEVKYHAGLFKAFVITLLILAFGRINFQSIMAWIALAGVIGYIEALNYKSREIELSRL